MPSLAPSTLGPILVAFASLIWATDSLVRYPAVAENDPNFLVLFEHLLAVILLGPWLALRRGWSCFHVPKAARLALLVCGALGSAAATVAFTESFRFVNPSVTILLQKLQPVFVLVLAFFLLKEKPQKSSLAWGFLALLAAIVVSFPDLDFSFFLDAKEQRRLLGVSLSLMAALFWAASNVFGKIMLEHMEPMLATFFRFLVGSVTMTVIFLAAGSSLTKSLQVSVMDWMIVLYLSLVPGVIAMIVYYKGLRHTPAGLASFLELLSPLIAIFLNTLILQTPLSAVQLTAGAILVFCVARIKHQH